MREPLLPPMSASEFEGILLNQARPAALPPQVSVDPFRSLTSQSRERVAEINSAQTHAAKSVQTQTDAHAVQRSAPPRPSGADQAQQSDKEIAIPEDLALRTQNLQLRYVDAFIKAISLRSSAGINHDDKKFLDDMKLLYDQSLWVINDNGRFVAADAFNGTPRLFLCADPNRKLLTGTEDLKNGRRVALLGNRPSGDKWMAMSMFYALQLSEALPSNSITLDPLGHTIAEVMAYQAEARIANIISNGKLQKTVEAVMMEHKIGTFHALVNRYHKNRGFKAALQRIVRSIDDNSVDSPNEDSPRMGFAIATIMLIIFSGGQALIAASSHDQKSRQSAVAALAAEFRATMKRLQA